MTYVNTATEYFLLDEDFDYQDDGDPCYVPVQEREVRHDD